VPTNVTTFDQTVYEPNNSKDEMHVEHMDNPPVKICSHDNVIVKSWVNVGSLRVARNRKRDMQKIGLN
jgi:hypothetical protein